MRVTVENAYKLVLYETPGNRSPSRAQLKTINFIAKNAAGPGVEYKIQHDTDSI